LPNGNKLVLRLPNGNKLVLRLPKQTLFPPYIPGLFF